MAEHIEPGGPAPPAAVAHTAAHVSTGDHGVPVLRAEDQPHPTAKKYLGIATILVFLTVIEVAVFYVPAMKPILAPVLLTLSAAKFAIVAMFYMHLKFDHPIFSWLFAAPMALAAAIILALLYLFGVFTPR